jgi:hypothetical protein
MIRNKLFITSMLIIMAGAGSAGAKDLVNGGKNLVGNGRNLLDSGENQVQKGRPIIESRPRKPCHVSIHKPKEGVMYEPGKTAEGWQVSSPHVAGTEPMQMTAEDVAIPLRKNLNDAYPIKNKHLDKDLTVIELGTVTFDKDGQLRGKPLGGAQDEPCEYMGEDMEAPAAQ